MPIYEYRCKSCDERFEKRVRMSTPVESIDCPECGEFDAKRLFSMFAGRTGGSGSLGSYSASSSLGTGGGCVPRGGFT